MATDGPEAASASRTASVRLRAPRSSAAASVGSAERTPIVADDPAYTPASSGSTERADHLVAETVGDQLGDRGIGAGAPAQRPAGLVADSGQCRVVHQSGERRRVRRDALQRVGGHRVQAPLAVDQRPRPCGADLPATQAQFGKQRGHLGTAGDERLRTDVHQLATDPLGAQHTSQPVSRVEQRDRSVGTRGDP